LHPVAKRQSHPQRQSYRKGVAFVASSPHASSNARRQLRFWRCIDRSAEANAVAADIERLVFREGVQPGRIAVVVPTSAVEGRAIESALRERAIPHRVLGSAALLSRPEVRDVLAWIRLLLNRDDAGAVARALLSPPVLMRHVDLAQVVQIARRRRLDIVSALPPSIESPLVPPEARERLQRFLRLHKELLAALGELSPERFLALLLERICSTRSKPLTGQVEIADLAESFAWLQDLAATFERSYPWSGARELAEHLVSISQAGGSLPIAASREEPNAARDAPPDAQPDGGPDARSAEQASDQARVAVQLLSLGSQCEQGVTHAYLLGLQQAALHRDSQVEEAAVWRAIESASESVVLSYPQSEEGVMSQPADFVERLRQASSCEWEDRAQGPAQPEEMIEAALRSMRQELLDGVSSIGARLGELRLDTDVDVSHGVVRYLELVKLAALLERPQGQSISDALSDVNARLLAAVTPLQREILESSTLDEELLGGRASGSQLAPALARAAAGEPSLLRFLPRKDGGLLLSASDIETYRSCPLRYKFARVLRIPSQITRNQRFGIAVHQALERYHASDGRTLPQLLQLLDVSWRNGGFREEGEDGLLRQKATTAMRRYHERLSEELSEPVWFERSFSFKIGCNHVRGRVDRVDRLPDGGHELIDYKTGRPKSEDQIAQDVQLSLYALAAQEDWKLPTSKQSYYHLLDDVKVPLPDGAAAPEWARSVAIDVGEAILSERFDPTPGKVACAMCDYRIVCPVSEG